MDSLSGTLKFFQPAQ